MQPWPTHREGEESGIQPRGRLVAKEPGEDKTTIFGHQEGRCSQTLPSSPCTKKLFYKYCCFILVPTGVLLQSEAKSILKLVLRVLFISALVKHHCFTSLTHSVRLVICFTFCTVRILPIERERESQGRIGMQPFSQLPFLLLVVVNFSVGSNEVF